MLAGDSERCGIGIGRAVDGLLPGHWFLKIAKITQSARPVQLCEAAWTHHADARCRSRRGWEMAGLSYVRCVPRIDGGEPEAVEMEAPACSLLCTGSNP